MHHRLSRLLKHRLLLHQLLLLRRCRFVHVKAPSLRQPNQAAFREAQGEGWGRCGRFLGWGAGGVVVAEREKLPSELPRPPTIPFQPRVANAMRLVGTVGAPVQLPDGRFSAVSVLVQRRGTDFPMFWIPVIFQDDLAQVASSHLHVNDLVYVSGQLTGDVPPFKHTDGDGQANIQVVANLLWFVDSKSAETDVMVEEEEGLMEIVEDEKKVEQLKVNPKYPKGTVSGYKDKHHKFRILWNDVLSSPHNWIDNRYGKKNGSKSVKYPDFTNKISNEGLWLDSAPTSVLENLDNLVYLVVATMRRKHIGINKDWSKFKTSKGSDEAKQKNEADLWQKLLDNPEKWWDNRSDKLSTKHPDFKHKETGEAMWIGFKTPRWVIDALPTMKAKMGNK